MSILGNIQNRPYTNVILKFINLEKKKRIWLCTSIVPVDSISQIQVMLLLLLLLLFTINIGEHLMDVLIT